MKKLFLLMLITIGMIVSAQSTLKLTINAYGTMDYTTKEETKTNLIYDLVVSKDYLYMDDYYMVYDKGSKVVGDTNHFFFEGIDDNGVIMALYLEADSNFGFIIFPRTNFAVFIEILKWEKLN